VNVLRGSIFLKIFALAAAIVAYFYIHNEIKISEKRELTDPSYEWIKPTAKSLKVNVRLETEAPEGYRVLLNQVSTKPSQVVVIGPEALLEHTPSAETAIVDVGESTRTITRKIPLESIGGIHLAGEPYYVDVTIPIEKTEKSEKPQPAKAI
jgi:YbbR domain-containing protein